jgi:hypothetical protein
MGRLLNCRVAPVVVDERLCGRMGEMHVADATDDDVVSRPLHTFGGDAFETDPCSAEKRGVVCTSKPGAVSEPAHSADRPLAAEGLSDVDLVLG